jgi:hypothetical protein
MFRDRMNAAMNTINQPSAGTSRQCCEKKVPESAFGKGPSKTASAPSAAEETNRP